MRIRISSLAVAALCFATLGPARPIEARADEPAWGPLELAHERVAPGERKKFTYLGERSFEGGFVDFVVFAAQGRKPGPRLCVTSAIHGDEINSVEIARRAFASVDAEQLAGTLIVLPAINTSGFRSGNRYMPDRRDLNRFFPGNRNGSIAALVAYAVFEGVIRGCTHLVDLHTGSMARSNSPQIRVDVADPQALELARHFSVGIIVEGAGPSGSLRREAMKAGIKAIIYEAGPPNIFLEPEIARGVEGVQNVMNYLGMTHTRPSPPEGKILTHSRWLRVPPGGGGIFLPTAKLGDAVHAGQTLATVTDPVTDRVTEIAAEADGVIVGIALPQVVLSGYGLFHVGELADQPEE
ncbi:MAG TPA: succinylglutamate desuccinylase/aspartoacylase family protein [Myxococcota bacterium]|jgi:hypothetical protein